MFDVHGDFLGGAEGSLQFALYAKDVKLSAVVCILYVAKILWIHREQEALLPINVRQAICHHKASILVSRVALIFWVAVEDNEPAVANALMGLLEVSLNLIQ